MKIGSAGSSNINLLQSDAFTWRNADIVTVSDYAFMGGFQVAAHGVNRSSVGLHNPTGSGVTVVIDAITMSTSANQIMGYGILTGGINFANKSGKSRLDADTSSIAILWSKQFSPTAFPYFLEVQMLADTAYVERFRYPFVLTENKTFYLIGKTNNIAITGTYEWREL
jgi:hypothetical protein